MESQLMRLTSTAIHEAGHILASSYFGNTPTLSTIEPGPGYWGRTSYDNCPPAHQAPAHVIIKAIAPEREAPGEPARHEVWREGSRESAICSLAGPVAEAIHLREDVHDVLDCNRSDRAAARAAIDQFVIVPGARAAAFRYLLREAQCLVRQRWRVITALAESLRDSPQAYWRADRVHYQRNRDRSGSQPLGELISTWLPIGASGRYDGLQWGS